MRSESQNAPIRRAESTFAGLHCCCSTGWTLHEDELTCWSREGSKALKAQLSIASDDLLLWWQQFYFRRSDDSELGIRRKAFPQPLKTDYDRHFLFVRFVLEPFRRISTPSPVDQRASNEKRLTRISKKTRQRQSLVAQFSPRSTHQVNENVQMITR